MDVTIRKININTLLIKRKGLIKMAKIKEIKLYSFDELDQYVQEKLIDERRQDEMDADMYSWHEENEKTLKRLADTLNVDLKSWEYDIYHHNVWIEANYDYYIEEYLYHLLDEEKINIDDQREKYEEKELELYDRIKDFKGEELQELLEVMYGRDLGSKEEWYLTGYYLDRIGLELIEKAYAGELDVTLEELLNMVFDYVLETCSEDLDGYYSTNEVMYRIKADDGNDYCYLEDGTYVG